MAAKRVAAGNEQSAAVREPARTLSRRPTAGTWTWEQGLWRRSSVWSFGPFPSLASSARSSGRQMAAAQPQGGFTVTVKHERTAHAVEVDGGTTVALLQTRLFLRSNVLPTRQKLMGFKGVPSPAPGATMSELKASGGMKLMMLPGPDRPPIDENADTSSPLFVPAVQAVWSACALCLRCTPAVTSEN